jgi:hypothetical protein
METILADVFLLVTAAFALTLPPGLRGSERFILARRDEGTALLIFLVLGLVEEITALIENVIQHGLHSLPQVQRLELGIRPAGDWLLVSVRDDGRGVPSADIEKVFFAEGPRLHALVLLRRRLQALFGDAFWIQLQSELGKGTTVTIRMPLRNSASTELRRSPIRHPKQSVLPASALAGDISGRVS